MSFAAEPFGLFAEDLLANLTGGESRVRFRYVDEELPFRLGEHEQVRPASLRVTGLVDGAFTRFDVPNEVALDSTGALVWQPGARVPDAGSDVWVGFDRLPGGPAPLLNDRNPGSVVSVLSGAFAREFAVVSRQLELVYKGAFVDTAGGRDLDQIGALVGVERRTALFAGGEVVFHRATPVPADVTIVAGTLISTATVPQVTVETTETVTLRRGTVSANAPVRSVTSGPGGVAPERSLTVIHRPIFGVDDVINPQPLRFGGGTETDDALRARIKRSFETAGRSTVGAIRGCLAALDGIREQDILVEEDHLAHPGIVQVRVAAEVDSATAVLAAQTLEEHRPAGVRIDHNLPAPTSLLPTVAADTGGGGDGPIPPEVDLAGVFVPIVARVTVTPTETQLAQAQQDALTSAVISALEAGIDAVGVGEPIIYNRLVAALMAVPGVLDATLDLGIKASEEAEPELRRFNIRLTDAAMRPRLDDGALMVELRGERVVIDVTATVERRGLAASAPASVALGAARTDIERRLTEAMRVTPPTLSPAVLLGAVPPTDDYTVETISYRLELLDEGVRVARRDVTLALTAGQVVWVRSVQVAENAVAS